MNALDRVYETRRNNLRRIALKREWSKEVLASKLGMKPSRLSHLIGPNPSRNIAESTAASIETKLQLGHGGLSVEVAVPKNESA